MPKFNPSNLPILNYSEVLKTAVEITSKREAQEYLRAWAAYMGGTPKAYATAKQTLRLYLPGQPVQIQKRVQSYFEL